MKTQINIKSLMKRTLVAACAMAFFLAAEHPGRCKANSGSLACSGSEQKALFTIPGSGGCGMKINSAAPKVSQKLQGDNSKVEKKESGKSISPYLSKKDATLDLLLSLRGKEQVPQEMKEILMRDTVKVSVIFKHELTASEIQSIEELGIEFVRLPNGDIAHSGTIYGAELPWDKVNDFAELKIVVRMESAWEVGVKEPIKR